MLKMFVAAFVWLAVLSPSFAHADPFLTPLLATAGITSTFIEIGGVAITYASIVSYTLTAGPAHGNLTVLP